MAKHRVFIGSSSEFVKYAEYIQLNLSSESSLEVVCWNQGVFQPSQYIIDDLLSQLEKMSFGIFLLTPDDYILKRGEEYYTVRDNILFEMGLYFGTVGRENTFFLVPDNGEYPIPSDLNGLSYIQYPIANDIDDMQHLLGPACTQLKHQISKQIKHSKTTKKHIEKFGEFPDFDTLYTPLFEKSTKISTSFIHSRRWRETNLKNINRFFLKPKAHWNVILPDITNEILLCHLKQHFNDGLTLVSKIIDAYDFYNSYLKKYPEKVDVYLYKFYPTYSFYKFDNKIIVSFYPLTSIRMPTPTILLDAEVSASEFFIINENDIIEMSRHVSGKELDTIITDNTNPIANVK